MAALCALPLLLSASARAQGAGEGGGSGAPQAPAPQGATGAPAAPVITPPSLAEFVEATYPPEARAAGLTATVEVVVTIAADGSVAEATVPTPVGNGFDEAAVEAVRRFRFEPARRDGNPIPSRIRYRYVFEIREEPPPPEEAAPPTTGRFAGQIVAEDDSSAVAAAELVVKDLETGEERRIVADAEGRFAIDELPEGRYQLTVSGVGLGSVTYEEEIVAGEETSVLYRLPRAGQEVADDANEPSYGARALIDPPPREMTRRTIEREALYRIPGTRGDPIRTIEILPGVARPPFGIGFVIIRGSAPQDSEILVDGVPVPLIYHFGGLTSVYNGRLINRLSFYPGNFSSRYGRKIGGVVEVETRDPRTDGFHGIADINVIDTSLLLEGPITRKFSLAGSFRRSLIDLILPYVIPSDASTLTAAPVYYDYQLIGTWRPTDRDNLRFQFYGSSDHFALIAKNSSESDQSAAENAIGLTTRFNNLQATWNRQLRGNTDQNVVFEVGPQHLEFNAGLDIKFQLETTQIYGRSQWLTRLSDHLRLVTGLDVSSGPFWITYIGPNAGQSEGNPGNTSSDTIGVKTNGFIFRPGVYADLTVEYGRFLVNSALRLDYYSEINGYSIDPRFVVQYQLRPEWKLKWAAGIYSQPPEFQESSADIGNPNLNPIHSAHFGTGVEYTPIEGFRFGVEGFYKQLWNRVVAGRTSNDPAYTNDGIGRIYGLELSASIQPSGRKYFGYLSYTLMQSERLDTKAQGWRPFDFDQTNILTASFVYRLPRNWEMGATFRFATGNPYTPVAGRVYNATDRYYQPIFGLINSARNPNFNRLDFRVQKTWQFDAWKLVWYLDVQNVYNHRSQEAVFYNYDYTLRTPVKGLPLIPALGIRGEF